MGRFLGILLDGVAYSPDWTAVLAPFRAEVLSVEPWPALLHREDPSALLVWLSERDPRRPLLGLTTAPFQEDGTPVRGYASSGKGLALVSACGLDSSALRTVIRHELGHAVGLSHCPLPSCALAFRPGEAAWDRGETFCPACADRFAALAGGTP